MAGGSRRGRSDLAGADGLGGGKAESDPDGGPARQLEPLGTKGGQNQCPASRPVSSMKTSSSDRSPGRNSVTTTPPVTSRCLISPERAGSTLMLNPPSPTDCTFSPPTSS